MRAMSMRVILALPVMLWIAPLHASEPEESADSLYLRGRKLFWGIDARVDRIEAVKAFNRAARSRHARSIAFLAVYHASPTYSNSPRRATSLPQNVLTLIVSEAESGDSDAQRLLGELYLTGFVTKAPYKGEVQRSIESSETGLRTFRFSMSVGAHPDPSLVPDPVSAKDWLEKAEAQGDPIASYLLALMYYQGVQGPKDEKTGDQSLERAAEGKLPAGMTTLGAKLLKDGRTSAETLRGVRLLKEAADAEFSPASYRLARCYEEGRGVPKNPTEARRLLENAAAQGHGDSLFLLSRYLLEGTGGSVDLARAFILAERAARLGHVDARALLGYYHLKGIGTPVDEGIAFRQFKSAASQGSLAGDVYLGHCYLHGWGCDQDEVRARAVFQRAADRKHAPAQYELAMLHSTGVGGPHSARMAIHWLEKAAKQNHLQARIALGEMAAGPTDRYVSREEMIEWLRKALDHPSATDDDRRRIRERLDQAGEPE